LSHQVHAEELRRRAGLHERFDITIEMIDAGVLRFERTMNADVRRHVAGERNLQLVGFRGHRVERLARDARVDLQQVVSCLLLRDYRFDRHFLGRRGLSVERWTARVDARTDDGAVRHARAVRQMPRIAQHAANGGHAVRDVEEERSLDR
jgi:hypothetical protein